MLTNPEKNTAYVSYNFRFTCNFYHKFLKPEYATLSGNKAGGGW